MTAQQYPPVQQPYIQILAYAGKWISVTSKVNRKINCDSPSCICDDMDICQLCEAIAMYGCTGNEKNDYDT
jgi:hypothetical protein